MQCCRNISKTFPTMSANNPLRKKFSALRRPSGPGNGWQARAARDLELSPGYVSKLIHGKAQSPAALAALEEWKRKNKVA